MSTTAPDNRITVYNPVVPTTEFEAQFPIFRNADLSVFLNGEELSTFAVSATYVDGISNDAKVTFATGLVGKVEVVGNRDPHRTNRFGPGPVPVRDINLALDTIEAEMQEARRDLSRALLAPYGETPPNTGEIIDAAQTAVDSAAAAQAAAASVNIKNVEDRVALKALDTTVTTLAFLRESGREGLFKWTPGNFSTQITADSLEGIYVKANAVASISGAWVRVLKDSLNLKWFGAVGDGVTSDQSAVQSAVSMALFLGKVLYVPATSAAYRLTATINVSGSLKLFGDGVDPGANYGPNEGSNSAGVVTRGAGSWFFIDHTGIGFRAISATASIMGIEYRRIGTYRTQPTPGAGFTPTNHDYDFSGAGVDILYEDIMLLNATRGIHQDVAANAYTYGRITCKRVRGQPLLSGIRIHNCYDACRLEDIHFWPFWSHNLGVWTYTKANLIAIDSGRNDNPILTNIFSIFHHIGLNVYNSPNGSTFRLQGMNMDIERGGYALVVDPAVVGFTAHLTNVVFQGEQGQVGNIGIYLRGTNNVIDIVNAEIFDFGASGVIVQGAGNMINFDNLTLNTWGLQGTGHFGIFADVATSVTIDGRIYGGATTGNGPLLGGTGAIRYPGLVTSGTVNITSAATSVTVQHGLPLTPPREKIQLTMLSGLGTGGGFWVSAATSTTFTIQLNASPGATITFGWRASLE